MIATAVVLPAMKLSVSIPKSDVEFLDAYATEHDIDSRSAVLHRAIRLLRTSQLGDQYAQASAEWEEGDHWSEHPGVP